jgi:hypothetical protein
MRVRQLFGTRDFAFHLDQKEPTLLTGTNGSGKSTVLRILNAVGTGNWRSLLKIPFKEVELIFENKTTFRLSRQDEGGIHLELNGAEYVLDPEHLSSDSLHEASDEELAELVPDVAPLNGGYFELQGRVVSRDELIADIAKRGAVRLGPEYANLAEFIHDFNLLFITDQRLVVTDERTRTLRNRTVRVPSRTAADAAAREVGRQMQSALSAYAGVSQRLDRDFPHRVISAMSSANDVPIERLTGLLNEVEQEQFALQRVGLLPRDLNPEAFRDLQLEDQKVRPVIETFAQDTKEKFVVLADLRARLTLFVEFLNQHFENKRVQTLPRRGFSVDIEGDVSHTIEPSSEPGTLVLIDEPELSLHVLWQDTFVEDLTRMGTARNLQFLLATHSPSLIGGREDLKRSLDAR